MTALFPPFSCYLAFWPLYCSLASRPTNQAQVQPLGRPPCQRGEGWQDKRVSKVGAWALTSPRGASRPYPPHLRLLPRVKAASLIRASPTVWSSQKPSFSHEPLQFCPSPPHRWLSPFPWPSGMASLLGAAPHGGIKSASARNQVGRTADPPAPVRQLREGHGTTTTAWDALCLGLGPLRTSWHHRLTKKQPNTIPFCKLNKEGVWEGQYTLAWKGDQKN